MRIEELGDENGMDIWDICRSRQRVVFDNDVSDAVTVIRLDTLDHTGAFFAAVEAIRGLGLVVRRAYVSVARGFLSDVLEVTDHYGNKVPSEPFRPCIEKAIEDAFKEAEAIDDDAIKEAEAIDDDAIKEAKAIKKPQWLATLSSVIAASLVRAFKRNFPDAPLQGRLLADSERKPFSPNSSWGFREDTRFSCSPSRMSGIDLMVGFECVHLPKHYSVHHPVVQMVLFATVSSSCDWFDRTYFTIKKESWSHLAKLHSGGVTLSKHPNVNEVLLIYTMTTHLRMDEQTLLNSSHYGEERMYALVMPRSLMSRDVGTVVLCLWLDSGASNHMVGDSTILINLRDLPIGRVITTADGSRHAITKVGDIQTPDIKIQDVFYVPGLQMSLVSVRQLAKSKVVTTFYENHAELWSEGERIGGAIVDDTVSLYKLRYLH